MAPRQASWILLFAAAAPFAAGGCGSCCSSKFCCPPRPAVVNAPPCNPCNAPGCGSRYAPVYTHTPAYPPGPPSTALYPPGPPPAGVKPMPNPAGPWQPAPGKPHVTEIPPKDNGVKVLPPIMPPAPEDQEKPKGPADFPADIPNYKLVMPNVASGSRPFADGYAWLQAKKYKTALYLRGPGEEDAPIRSEVESRGIKLIVLDVSPDKLDRELVKDFSRVVNDSDNYPLFVFDKKGMTAGVMWYLHFRLTQQEPEERALELGKLLGLKEGEEYRDWWQAINKLVKP